MATKQGKNKAKPKRRKRIGHVVPHFNTRRAFHRAIDAFTQDGDPKLALTFLQQIEAQGSMSKDVIELYLDVLNELGEEGLYACITNLMAERFPNDPMSHFLAGFGAYSTMQPISALLYFERFLELAPQHPHAAKVEKNVAKLRLLLPELLDAFIDDLPKDLPRIASAEKILHAFQLLRFDDVITRAQRHLQAYPTDLRIRNNLAEAFALKGDGKQALIIINETLDIAPNNFYARAVRCRLAYLQGDSEQCRTDAQMLLDLNPRLISDLTKAAQSFAYIGDDSGVRWAFEQAEQRGWLDQSPSDTALLMSFYATSLAIAGDTKSAKSYWKQAVKLAGPATVAQENLDDLRRPSGERWGPAFFDLSSWLSQSQQDDLRLHEVICSEGDDEDDQDAAADTFVQSANRLLNHYPEIERLIPAMLSRGDALSQQFAVMIGIVSQHPDVKAALAEYAKGSRGTDELRYHVLVTLKNSGALSPSKVAFSVKGEEKQIEVFDFQITDEPSGPEYRSEETKDLLVAAVEALWKRDGVEAERLLRQVPPVDSSDPTVQNNLAAALELQDRMGEADSIIDQVIEQNPDYFFGKIALAGRAITRSDYDDAHKILVDLQHRESLHTTEFYALAKLLIHTYVGKNEFASAQRWLDTLKAYAPDHQDIPLLSALIAGNKIKKGWLRRLWKSE